MKQRSKGGGTVPQIFIGGTYIGGCTNLYELDQSGKLDSLLSADQTVSSPKSVNNIMRFYED